MAHFINRELERQTKWTEAISMGERDFVVAIEVQVWWRQRMSVVEQDGGLGPVGGG